VLKQSGEITHTWADLNVIDWDVEEVLQYPIQNDLLDTYLCAEY
jgi:hypothetical protein